MVVRYRQPGPDVPVTLCPPPCVFVHPPRVCPPPPGLSTPLWVCPHTPHVWYLYEAEHQEPRTSHCSCLEHCFLFPLVNKPNRISEERHTEFSDGSNFSLISTPRFIRIHLNKHKIRWHSLSTLCPHFADNRNHNTNALKPCGKLKVGDIKGSKTQKPFIFSFETTIV